MKTILVVDDNKINLLAAKKALDELYKVIAVPSGTHALKFFENNTCDLVLLDIYMPEMDGFEALQKIRQIESCKQIPVAFLTADNDSGTYDKCKNAGAVDCITKPFLAETLCSKIAKIFEQ